MKILLHTCCGPCLLYPLKVLQEKGFEVSLYFYNPNIHPYREFQKRLETLVHLATERNITLFCRDDYGLVEFTRNIVFHEDSRCSICYDMRLENTIRFAKLHGFDTFSTTLLYSKYQKHEQLCSKSRNLAALHGVSFFYHDFREGWQEGIDESKKICLYRQAYCGCIYSEQGRYDKKLRKKSISNITTPRG